jgi:hypothetical protein
VSKHVGIERGATAFGVPKIVVTILDRPQPIDPGLVLSKSIDDGYGDGVHNAWLAGDYFHFESAYRVEPAATVDARQAQNFADTEGWGGVYQSIVYYRNGGLRFFFDCAGLDADHNLCALTLKANFNNVGGDPGAGPIHSLDFGRVAYWLLERQP